MTSTLSQIAEKIAREIPVAFCRICLLDNQDDVLEIAGAYPLNSAPGWDPGIGTKQTINSVPNLVKAIASRSCLIFNRQEIQAYVSQNNGADFLFPGVSTIGFFH